MTDPEWGPTGKGKVVRVVYPIEMSDGTISITLQNERMLLKFNCSYKPEPYE